jgi:hypothetical protein
MSNYKGNNEGGYGNPPISGQFQKGNKGGGRPKGSVSVEGVLRKLYRGKIPYTENGERREAVPAEALAKRGLQLGLSGSQKANEAALQLARKYGYQDDEITPNKEFSCIQDLTDEELRELGRLLGKATGDPSLEASAPVNPFAYLRDPDDPRNFVTELTVDGLHYNRSSSPHFGDQLLEICPRGYRSAALPRKNEFCRDTR